MLSYLSLNFWLPLSFKIFFCGIIINNQRRATSYNISYHIHISHEKMLCSPVIVIQSRIWKKWKCESEKVLEKILLLSVNRLYQSSINQFRESNSYFILRLKQFHFRDPWSQRTNNSGKLLLVNYHRASMSENVASFIVYCGLGKFE